MNSSRSVCVILGSNVGQGDQYINAAKQLGKELAKRSIALIYGGGKLGLMGALADAVLRNGGKAIGVITSNLLHLEGHLGLTKLHVVETMQERKLLMAQLSDGCIALPGGLGTLEEFFEFWNASKLGLYDKHIGLLNINNYYDKLFDFLSFCIVQDFIKKDQLNLLTVKNYPGDLLDVMFSESKQQEVNNDGQQARLFM